MVMSRSCLLLIICFILWQLAFPIKGLTQETFVDSVELEEVSIIRSRGLYGNGLTLKTQRLDSLVIAEKKAFSLSEILFENSPVFVKTYGRGSEATTSFRGTGASHTNIYWNGLKVNSPLSGETDLSLIPMFFVDEVNVFFGQSSMLFGSGGLGGAINLSSHPNWNTDYGVIVYQSLGSYSTYSTAVSLDYGERKLKAQTRVFREASQNDFTYTNTAKIDRPMETQKNADYLKMGILQEIYFRPKPQYLLSARVWLQENSRGIPPLMANYSVEEDNRQSHRNLYSIVDFVKSSESWNLKSSSGVSINKTNYWFNKASFNGDIIPIIDSHSNSFSWSNGLSFYKELSTMIQTNLSAEFNHSAVSSKERLTTISYQGKQNHGVIRSTTTFKLSKRLNLNILLSKESFDHEVSPLLYSFSYEYKPFKQQELYLKGGLARNYHHPSLNDLYGQPGGNKNLKPEDGTTWDLGVNHSFELESTKVTVVASHFSSKIESWIIWLPHLKGYWEPINLDLVYARGLETSTSIDYTFGEVKIKLLANYNFTRSTIENGGIWLKPENKGKQIPFFPIHSGGFVLNTSYKKIFATYSFTHFSERFTTTSNNPNILRRLYPYYMSSLAIGSNLRFKNTNIGTQLRVDNLLNESYQTILWRPMPGRNFNILFRIEL